MPANSDRDVLETTAHVLHFGSPEQLITYICSGMRFSNEREVIQQNIKRFKETGEVPDYIRAWCVGATRAA